MMIEAIDFDGNRKPTGVDSIDAVEIQVLVVSGDEILTIRKTDGTVVVVDAGKGRIINFFDGEYTVADIEKWMQRETAYDDWFEFGE